MYNSRAEKVQGITDAMKDLTRFGRSVKNPTTLRYIPPGQSRLPEAVGGSQVVRILMIGIASLLLIGVILLCVDQWITPIFQRAPGDGAYIPVPGVDPSELFWMNSNGINDIKIGVPSTSSSAGVLLSPPSSVGSTEPLRTNVLENQGNYGITMDVLIQDEYPQNLGKDFSGHDINERTFFFLGSAINAQPSLTVSIDNTTNTCNINAFDSDRQPQSITIDNVPIHTPFRIGISMSPLVMEGYLNGLLVKTRQLKTTTILPGTGDTIFAPANIVINGNVVSQGIKVRNLRCFGYTVPSSEMKGRMNDGLLNPAAWKA